MSLSSYLATHYLNPSTDPSTTHKRKKRKHNPPADTDISTSNLTIADDDPAFPPAANASSDEENNPVIEGTSQRRAKFKRSNFKSLNSTTDAPAEKTEGDEADRLIEAANLERNQRANEDEDVPEIVGNGEEDEAGEARMQSGAKAGLQSAKDVTADLKRRQREERKRLEKTTNGQKSSETVYRDASGRVVNVAMARAEARKAEEDKRRKEEEGRKAIGGTVQEREREERRRDLESAKGGAFARGVEDEGMNKELKAQGRWGDPMAGVSILKDRGGGGGEAAAKGKGGKSARVYKGAFEPNRYGISPGHRWDGVDRGIGFERKWWAVRNERKRGEGLRQMWEMDV
ncbi:MAG: hypothetical protein Q9159_000010 [Coniocarpon cinnabarinum]